MTVVVTSLFFFFKQKTAYEITASDWSSDVCSSDLDHRGADPDAGEAELRDRRVHHPLRPEFLEQPAAHLVGAVVLGHFLAHEEDAVVPPHLLAERLIEGVAVRNDRHRCSPSRFSLPPTSWSAYTS